MKVIVRKIGKYDPIILGLGKYKNLARLTIYQSDPGLVADEPERLRRLFGNLGKVDLVMASDFKRAKETGAIAADLVKAPLKLDERLREIKFKMENLLTGEKYGELGSDLVRKRFIDAFIADSLIEKREEIQTRMESILNDLFQKGLNSVLLVSHSFLMKLMNIYHCQSVNIFSDPKLLKEHFDPDKKTFEFGEGFEFCL